MTISCSICCWIEGVSKQFAGLVSEDQVPDQKTLWKYRDLLSKCGGLEELFLRFKDQLLERGYRLNSGQIVDSSIVSIPVQRLSRGQCDDQGWWGA